MYDYGSVHKQTNDTYNFFRIICSFDGCAYDGGQIKGWWTNKRMVDFNT